MKIIPTGWKIPPIERFNVSGAPSQSEPKLLGKVDIKDLQKEFNEVIAVEALNVSVKERWVTENDKTENSLDAKTKGCLLEETRSFLFSVTLVIMNIF